MAVEFDEFNTVENEDISSAQGENSTDDTDFFVQAGEAFDDNTLFPENSLDEDAIVPVLDGKDNNILFCIVERGKTKQFFNADERNPLVFVFEHGFFFKKRNALFMGEKDLINVERGKCVEIIVSFKEGD